MFASLDGIIATKMESSLKGKNLLHQEPVFLVHPIEKEGKNESGRVASPENVLSHLEA